MRRVGLSLGMAGIAAALASIPALAQQPAWSLDAEVIRSWRGRGASPPITVNDTPPLADNERLLAFDSLDDAPGWGGGLRIGYALSPGLSVWVRGTHSGNLGGKSQLTTVPADQLRGTASTAFSAAPGNDTTTNNTLGGFKALTADTRTRLVSLEANVEATFARSGGARLALFGGPRAFHLRDRLAMSFFEEDDDLLGLDTEFQSLSIDVRNRLLGGQIGLAGEIPVTSGLVLSASAAIGVFANEVDRRRTFFEGEGQTLVVDDKLTGRATAWAGDAGATLSFILGPQSRLDVGYRAIWLGNVSLAPSHFERAATRVDPNPRADSDLLVHAVRVGASLRF